MLGRGRVLLGGAPLRIVRLSDGGARVVRDLFRGSPVGDRPQRAALARRLVALGLAHPDPSPEAATAATAGELAVVIPVKDDPDAVARTLAALLAAGDGGGCGPAGSDDRDEGGGSQQGGPEAPAGRVRPDGADGPGLAVVVIDDGSSRPEALAAAVAGRAPVVRRAATGGPGAARTTGLEAPAGAAAAPRIASTPGPGRIARYEATGSPLDLGTAPGPARPGSPVPYVPTACLVVRTRALVEVGGFDAGLRFGEDVDLVWRLVERGFDVRYDPSVIATHPPRSTLRAWVRQRVSYGSSAGPLARRHGSMVAPSRCSGWSAAVWGLAVTGHPVLAVAVAGWTARALRPKLGALPDPAVEAVRLTATGHWWAGRNLSRQLVRTWWPLTALAALRWRFGRRLLAAGVAASAADRWGADRDHRMVTVALGLLDDVAYGTGVWWGLRRGGGASAVLPHLVAWPVDRREPAAADLTGR